MIDWNQINSVFLDMDGTLLDLHYDDYFWQHYLPEAYAKQHNIDESDAKRSLAQIFKNHEGTLNWYCLDFWTEELKIDVVGLKAEVKHLIAMHEGVADFLHYLCSLDKRIVLVTNAHRKVLDLKLAHTELGDFLDRIISSHDLGLPKEEPLFWEKLREREPFDREKTLFVDDSLAVLNSAKTYGIVHLFTIRQPSTRKPKRDNLPYPALDNFRQLITTA